MRPLLDRYGANGFISPEYQVRERVYQQMATLFNEMHRHILEDRENDPHSDGPFLQATFQRHTPISPNPTSFNLNDNFFNYWNAIDFNAKQFPNMDCLHGISPYFQGAEALSPEGTQIRAKVHNILFLLTDAVERNRLDP